MKTIKVNYWTEVPKYFTGIAEYLNGTKQWYKEGRFHREDGPAVEWSNGSKHWFKDGNCHREDGPAVEEPYHREWYLNDTKIFCSCDLRSILSFKDKVVLSKETHELYPKIQKWKVLSKNEIYDVLIFPGLEMYVLE